MSRLILPPGVRESVESVDGGGYGAAALDQRERVPTGSLCPCGNPLPWAHIAETREDAGTERELRCNRCRRQYVVMAGLCWED